MVGSLLRTWISSVPKSTVSLAACPLPVRPYPRQPQGIAPQYPQQFIQEYLPQPTVLEPSEPHFDWTDTPSSEPSNASILSFETSPPESSILLNQAHPEPPAVSPSTPLNPARVEEVAPRSHSDEPESASDLLKDPAAKDPYSAESASRRTPLNIPRTAQRIAEPHNTFPRLRR